MSDSTSNIPDNPNRTAAKPEMTPPPLDLFQKSEPSTHNRALSSEHLYKAMETALLASVTEQRRGRRWGIFFKLLGFGYLLVLLSFMAFPFNFGAINNSYVMLDENGQPFKTHTALITLKGTIASDTEASSDNLIANLRRAFANPETDAVILEINSGGGSPVQSGYVYDEIKRLRGIHPKIKLYAVITDIGASGAYYIAAAADEIYADKASLVGSIGVTGASFGFVDTMKMVGVERRLYTSGEHKAFLDPFQPMNDVETDFWKTQLTHIHEQFIKVVRDGRGKRLKETPDMFSGLIWNGETALEMGLIDGLGSARFVARDIIKSPKLVRFNIEESVFDRLVKRFGVSVGSQLANEINNKGLQLK